MPDGVGTAEALLAAGSGIVVLLTGVLVLLRKAFVGMRRLSRFLDDWFGTESTPGVIVRIEKVENSVNGGSELYKEVQGVSVKVDEVKDELRSHLKVADERYQFILGMIGRGQQ